MRSPVLDLHEFHRALSTKPLWTQEELDRWYEPALDRLRSAHPLVSQLELKLKQEEAFFHGFVYGHRGCGKSTELTRLVLRVAPRQPDGPGYRAVRVSAANELPPTGFKPLDILLLIMARLAEELEKLGESPSEKLVRRVWEWFLTEKKTSIASRTVSGQASAGGGVDRKSIWANLLGVFAEIRGELKLASQESTERVEYAIKRLTSLIDVLNAFLADCQQKLPEGQKWLLIFEDFDKAPNQRSIEEIFVDKGPALLQMNVDAIFTIPAALACAKNSSLPFDCFPLYDTPVFDRAHGPFPAGRHAMRSMLARRIDLARFESSHQVDRLIVASGGHPRDLFDMADEAATSAILSGRGVIQADDVTYAIARQRRQTYLRLGEDPFETTPVKSDQKLQRLGALYVDPSRKGLPDQVTYSLLNGRLLQEFNTEGWFGVPPLVVDILIEMGTLEAGSAGGLLPVQP